jgi:hypothetical protein
MFGDSDGFISTLIAYLHSKYKKRCNNPKTIDAEIIEMNNNIRMLLELDVLGIQKTNTIKVD